MRVVLVMFKDGERRDFAMSGAKTIIGRKADATLRIPTADVSREHCEVELVGNDVVLRDLGSSNGTYLNGKRIAEARVMAGDKVSIGPVTFIVQINGLPPKITPFDVRPEPQAAAAKSAPAPAAKAMTAPRSAAPQSKPATPAASKPAASKPAAPAAPGKGSPLDDELDEILDLGEADLDDMFDDDNDDDDTPPKKK